MSILLTLCIALSLLPPMPALAAATSGTCGAEGNENSVTWTYASVGSIRTITISGTGPMADYQNLIETPWYSCSGSSSTQAVTIEEGVTTVGDNCFYKFSNYMTTLSKIRLPSTITSIGVLDFSSLAGQVEVTFAEPSQLKTFGRFAFSGCSGLYDITIPDSVTEIGVLAFSDCDRLTNVVIPEGVTTIRGGAFKGCDELAGLTLPVSLQSIEYCDDYYADWALDSNPKLTNVTFNGTEERWTALTADLPEEHSLKKATVTFLNREPGAPTTYKASFAPGNGSGTMEPQTVTKGVDDTIALPECAFSAPAGYAFAGWSLGETLYSPGDQYTVKGDVTFTATWEKILTGACGTGVTWTIAGNILTISGTGAMEDYTDTLQIPWRAYSINTHSLDVVIGEGVTKIGDSAFLSCALNNVTIAGTVKTIPNGAFYGSSVKSVTLQPGLECIEGEAFMDCKGLTEITIPATVKTIRRNAVAFSGEVENTLTTVNFGGTKEQWDSLGITADNNAALYNATLNTTDGSTHKISFEPGASGIDPNLMPAVFVTAGSSFTLPENRFAAPTGMHFTGWQIAGEVKAVGDVITVTGPVALTAQWANNRHKMTFQAGQGTGSMPEVEIEANTSYTLPECVFTPPVGKRFTGWSVNGVTYQPNDAYPVTGDAIAAAQWENKPCTITFAGGDSEASGTMDPVAATGNSAYTLPSCAFTVPGKRFYRWSVDGVEYSPSDVITITDDVTITALWKNLYTITFQAGEGSGAMPEAVVADGDTYQLPSCAFTAPEDKRFQAWQIKGQSYAPSQEITVTTDLTVTALWTNSQVISFDAGGGSGSMADVPYTQGMSYVLPECGFTPPAGASFKAWLIDGREYAPGAPYPLQTGATIHAVWLMHYTVTLNPNAPEAAVAVPGISVTQGQPYGELPAPTWEGYGFTGWFTAAEGGYLVDKDTLVTRADDHTLYAHWSVINVGDEMSYRFPNSQSGLGYSSKGRERIPYYIYVKMFGDNAMSRMYYNFLGAWKGSCYGMATSAAILYQPGSGVKPGNFKTGAVKPYDLRISDYNEALDMDVRDFVEMMMVSQFEYARQNYVGQDLTEIFDVLKKVQEGQSPPVEITIHGRRNGAMISHAVIGIAAEDVSEMEGRLYVYDGNYPYYPSYIRLFRSSPTGPYTSWYYDERFSGNWFYYVKYEDFYRIWANRAELKQSRAADTGSGNTRELLAVNSSNVEIYDASGTKVATVVNGELITDREDISQLQVCNDPETPEEGSYYVHDTAVWLPVGLYTVVNQEEKSEGEKFQATMVHVNQAAQVAATGDTISFLVNDNAVDESSESAPVNYVRLAEPDAGYEITLSSSLDSTYKETKLTGIGDNKPVAFAQIDSQLHADGVDLTSPEAKIEARQPEDPDGEPDTETGWTPIANAEDHVNEMPDTAGTEVKKATMTFNANGGSGSMAPQTATIGTFFILPQCEFAAPSGKAFDGWAVGSPDSETKKQTGESFLAQGDTTLYPLWKSTGASSGGTQTVIVPSPSVTASPSPSPSPSPDESPSPSPDGTPSPSPDESPSPSPDGTPTPPPDGTPTPSPEPWENPFPDVPDAAWYSEAVAFAARNGLMVGYANGQFGPENEISRAEFAQILYSQAGKPSAGAGRFTDVKAGAWYANAVNWAAEKGCVSGYPDGRFGPSDKITREAMAMMIWRYAGSPVPKQSALDYADANKVSGYARDAMLWANENGIINGKGNGMLDPKGKATRAETAQMLMRYLTKNT